MIRSGGRRPSELRPTTIVPGYRPHAEGSALIDMGETRVLCAVTVEDRLPRFAIGSGSGWITAEYGMLPRSTHTRTARETSGRSRRTAEIPCLIRPSLRSAPQLELLGAAADFNMVMTEAGEFPEVQGTGESHPFTRAEMNQLLDLSEAGIGRLFQIQKSALAEAGIALPSPIAAKT